MYQNIEDTVSDIGIEVFSKNFIELIKDSCTALSSNMCYIEKIKPNKSIKVEISAKNLTELMYNLLSTILTKSDIFNMFFSVFEINSFYLTFKSELNNINTLIKKDNLSALDYLKNIKKDKNGTFYRSGLNNVPINDLNPNKIKGSLNKNRKYSYYHIKITKQNDKLLIPFIDSVDYNLLIKYFDFFRLIIDKTNLNKNKNKFFFHLSLTLKGEKMKQSTSKLNIKAITYYDFILKHLYDDKLFSKQKKNYEWYFRFVCDV